MSFQKQSQANVNVGGTNDDLGYFLVPKNGRGRTKAYTLVVENCAFPETSLF